MCKETETASAASEATEAQNQAAPETPESEHPKAKSKAKEAPKLSEQEQFEQIDDILSSIPSAAEANALWKIATKLWESGMFRSAGSPAGCFAILMYGHEVGLKPMQAMTNISVIEGKPAMSSQLMQSIAEARGVRVKTLQYDTEKCQVELQYGDKKPEKFSYTLEDVKRAGLDGRKNHQRYPRAMLHWRCLSEGLRMYAPGVLLQAYTFDELSDGRARDLAGFLEVGESDFNDDDSKADSTSASVANDLKDQVNGSSSKSHSNGSFGERMTLLTSYKKNRLVAMAAKEALETFKNNREEGDCFIKKLVQDGELRDEDFTMCNKADLARFIIALWNVQDRGE